ncbi:hypothetical protein B0T11DRAFT_356373 [Plectosphaerella cucumerina]|uniref:Uncharacterized protein n=1 Tax=Plectosphaerella cucumerina TaxID=40658 RepID=A0A8K0X0L2_9PEZI|nr:hypothetical protein B0T11DRAFT_356373 [Plectosphaerella cucumerina]
METTSFTFLNTTGAPRLSKPAAKRVRGHVTRTNFANRRRRKAEAADKTATALVGVTHDVAYPPCNGSNHDAWDALADALSVATSTSGQDESARLLNEFWSVIFLGSRGIPGGQDDQAWMQLLASEPALVEASLSMAVRCWSTKANCNMRADFHACRATGLLIQRIGSREAYTDGFLGAAFTMALNERLLRNDEAWKVHIGGIIQAVRGRRAQGLPGLPPLFTDLVILDTANGIIDFPRVCHPCLVKDLVDNDDGSIISVLNDTSDKVSRLRKTIEAHRKHPLDEESVALFIQRPYDQLIAEIDSLLGHENAYTRNTAKAIELILSLSWPMETDEAKSSSLAAELKDGLAALPGRSCLYMDVTSCPIIVGAIASAYES